MPLVAASKKLIQFDLKTFLSTINGGGRKIAVFSKKQTIFVQGDSSDAVLKSAYSIAMRLTEIP
jgi:hypothetical protein